MYTLWLAFVACFHLTHAQLDSPIFPNSTNVTTMSFDDGNFNVSWMYNQTTDTLHFALDVNTTGWVGFGFTFTPPPQHMNRYDVVVGGWKDTGEYFHDYHTKGEFKPILDANQSYVLENATEENGITSLRFNRLRNTTDENAGDDIQFNFTAQAYLVWAYHDTDDAIGAEIFSRHTHRNHTMEPVQIVVSGPNMTDTTEEPTTMTTAPPSSGRQLGFSLITIAMATILCVFMK